MVTLPAVCRRTVALLPVFLLAAACGEGVLSSDLEPAQAAPVQALENSPVQSVLHTRLIPEEQTCVHRSETPLTPEEAARVGVDDAFTRRSFDPDEVDASIPDLEAESLVDRIELSPSVGNLREAWEAQGVVVDLSGFFSWLAFDSDGDCLANGAELDIGTDWADPDTDNDGWYDGPCNERRLLYIERIKAHDEQEDWGDDETYFILDDIRHPSGDLDDYWNFDDGQSRNPYRLVAERTRGTNTSSQLRNVHLEAWEDDVEIINIWTVDDLLFTMDIDVGAHANGQTFSIRRVYDDWDYEIRFRVDVQYFADPNPTLDADTDGDGIRESAEFAVARDFGGITDPAKRDILVEVDYMSGHGLRTNAKRLVATQLYRHGYHPYIHRDRSLPVDGCLTRTEARNRYLSDFTFGGYDAFRYAIMTEVIWNDASGVAIGDTFMMDDSTWWINGGILAQAGTFIHELGHTLSLTQSNTFRLIDTVAWFSYDSAMNYTFQPTKVNFSSDGAGGGSGDHNDWADVDPAYGLQYSFGLSTHSDNGVCD